MFWRNRPKASMPAAIRYFAWGCFRYFVESEPSPRSFQSVFAFASLKLRRTPRFALQVPRGCATRSPKGEAWWARQDSNLQPDRYERPALTIELQAPPECRIKRPATVPTPLTMLPAIRQCRVPRFGTFARPTALRAG